MMLEKKLFRLRRVMGKKKVLVYLGVSEKDIILFGVIDPKNAIDDWDDDSGENELDISNVKRFNKKIVRFKPSYFG